MNIGRLDRKITIESYTTAVNAIGEDVGTWSTYHTAAAAISKGTGLEKPEGGKVTATNKVRFKIRYFAGIDETMRVVYNSNYYDIHEIQELDREGLWITASKKI